MLKLDLLPHRFDDVRTDYSLTLKQALAQSVPNTPETNAVWNFDSEPRDNLIVRHGLFLVKCNGLSNTTRMLRAIHYKRCFRIADFRTALAFNKRHGEQIQDWLKEGTTGFSRAMGIVPIERFHDGFNWCHPYLSKLEGFPHDENPPKFEAMSNIIRNGFQWPKEFHFLVEEI